MHKKHLIREDRCVRADFGGRGTDGEHSRRGERVGRVFGPCCSGSLRYRPLFSSVPFFRHTFAA